MEQSSEEVRVLLVEDDTALAQGYRVKLERDGYTVTVAGDGEEALSMLSADLPDLIFLDMWLPCRDGLAFLEKLRVGDRTKNVPVVIVSNYTEEDLVAGGLQLGALEHLIKSQSVPSAAKYAASYPGPPRAGVLPS